MVRQGKRDWIRRHDESTHLFNCVAFGKALHAVVIGRHAQLRVKEPFEQHNNDRNQQQAADRCTTTPLVRLGDDETIAVDLGFEALT